MTRQPATRAHGEAPEVSRQVPWISSLSNFLIKTYTEEGFPRPADMRAALAQTLSLIAGRPGTTWTPPDAPAT